MLGVRPDPEAVEAVLTWQAPRTDTQLMTFLGFCHFSGTLDREEMSELSDISTEIVKTR